MDDSAESENKQLKRLVVVLVVLFLLGMAYMFFGFVQDSAPPEIQLETLEEIFIDVDGDGDLDYVHSVQFVRQTSQENRESRENPNIPTNPTPAPNQPGQ